MTFQFLYRGILTIAVTTLLANAAVAGTVTWLSDSRSVISIWSGELQDADFGTTTWDVSVGPFYENAAQNTTIDTTAIFGGTGSVYFDGSLGEGAFSSFGVTFRVGDGGTTLDLTGSYGAGSNLPGLSGGVAGFRLLEGENLIYQATGDVIDYSGFLSAGDYTIIAEANVYGRGFNEGGAAYDFSGEFGTAEVAFVPVPAALWLFGSALAGLGWIRRKRVA
jgi:hypothetical protein